jgi:hypothetical protein
VVTEGQVPHDSLAERAPRTPAPESASAARQADDERDTPVPESPFYASTRLLASLARGPARELPGLRFVLRPQFDVTPELPAGSGSVAAGTVLDWNRVPAGTPFTTVLRKMDTRTRDCALSQAVDAAVAARTPAISTRVSPAALAAHVANAMRGTLSMGTSGCATEEPEWLAPAYRWSLVKDALNTAARSGGTGRHPRSDEWERVYGEPIPGATVAEQARIVNRWSARDHDDAAAVSAVIWGTRPRTRIEQAVGTRASGPAWPARLADLLGAFVTVAWPRNLLRHTPEAERR